MGKKTVSFKEAKSHVSSPTVIEWWSQDKNPCLCVSNVGTCPTLLVSLLGPKGPPTSNPYSGVVRPGAHFSNPIGCGQVSV